MHMRKILLFLQILFIQVSVFAQDDFTYRTPPKDILDLVMAKPTPGVSIDSKGEWMILLERSTFPSIEELAQPELRIAGLRINPKNFGPSRVAYSVNFTLKNIKTKETFTITGLPENMRAGSIQWSPDEKKFAFVNSKNDRIDLYVVDLNSKTAKQINSAALNTVTGGSYSWAGNDKLIYKTVPANYRKYPDAPLAPKGPVVQENLGKAAASRTYQDLIKNPYDEDLFGYMSTAQLVVNDLSTERSLGEPSIFMGISVSPDKNYLLVETIDRPFSYLVPAYDFPHTVSVMEINGNSHAELLKNPSSEGQPIGFDDVVSFPRNFDWRDDEPSTLVFVQALDKGLGRSKSEFRDALYAINLPDPKLAAGGQASAQNEVLANSLKNKKELFRTQRRLRNVIWGNNNLALVYQATVFDRKLQIFQYNPSTNALDLGKRKK